jgi:hypothetical protein
MGSDIDSDAIAKFREAVQSEQVIIRIQTHPYIESRTITANWGNGFVLKGWQNTASLTFGDYCGEILLERHNEDGIVSPSEILDLVDEILDE